MPSSTSFPASCTEPAIDARALSGPLAAPLIHDVDLHVAAGETLVVLGPSQSGKTTLMRHLLGLERALRGSVTLGGQRFDASLPPDATLRGVRARIGVVFE